MATNPRDNHESKKPVEGARETVDQASKRADRGLGGRLDGSTSGTIGGGGRESGGPTHHGHAPDMPEVNPDDAASGRRAPDALGAAEPHDPLKTGRTDTNRK